MIGGFRQVIQKEGAGALLTGFGPTAAGYFLQGAFKFGGYEFFKQANINLLGYETASQYRTGVYLASAGCAEFIADIALVCCVPPSEGNPANANNSCSALSRPPVSASCLSPRTPTVSLAASPRC